MHATLHGSFVSTSDAAASALERCVCEERTAMQRRDR